MSKHRADPPLRVRARFGRMAAATVSLMVTAVALLGGIGIIPVRAGDDASATGARGDTRAAAAADRSAAAQDQDPAREITGVGSPESPSPLTRTTAKPDNSQTEKPSTSLPASSGSGRRVVFSEESQRVWLVGAKGRVISTYLVSGSLTDNLHPGSYDVYSRSRWAVGVDDSGVMQYFVRFTRGNNAAIGFHSIPTKNGTALQTIAQLGSPRSHGCVRQRMADAERMWDFAPVGTQVVVI